MEKKCLNDENVTKFIIYDSFLFTKYIMNKKTMKITREGCICLFSFSIDTLQVYIQHSNLF